MTDHELAALLAAEAGRLLLDVRAEFADAAAQDRKDAGDKRSHDFLMAALAAGTADRDFHETKLATGRYYMARQLPMTKTHLARIETGAAPVMGLAAENF